MRRSSGSPCPTSQAPTARCSWTPRCPTCRASRAPSSASPACRAPMSVVDIRAPAEQTEGTRLQILRWLKRPGDAAACDEPLIEIETDKVTVEVASPGAGVLREILKHEQDEVAPGELLGRLEAQGSVAPTAKVTAVTPAAVAASAPRAATARAGAAVSPAVRRLL